MKINSNRIRIMLAEAGKSQADLSEDSGLSKQSISAALARGTCRITTAGKLAHGLGVSVTEILEVTE